MLTPQDIKDKTFVRAMFGGYDMSSVDDFIEALQEDYGNLFKENAILKSKLKVLVDKVEEYRSTEDSMRMALLTAQRMAGEITGEAEKKRDELLKNAESDAAARRKELSDSCSEEEARLAAAKRATADYVAAVKSACSDQLAFLDRLDGLVVTPPVESHPEPSREEDIDETVKSIENSVSSIYSDEPEAAVDAAAPTVDSSGDTRKFSPVKSPINWDDVDEPTTPRPKFNFKDLQFGENYKKD